MAHRRTLLSVWWLPGDKDLYGHHSVAFTFDNHVHDTMQLHKFLDTFMVTSHAAYSMDYSNPVTAVACLGLTCEAVRARWVMYSNKARVPGNFNGSLMEALVERMRVPHFKHILSQAISLIPKIYKYGIPADAFELLPWEWFPDSIVSAIMQPSCIGQSYHITIGLQMLKHCEPNTGSCSQQSLAMLYEFFKRFNAMGTLERPLRIPVHRFVNKVTALVRAKLPYVLNIELEMYNGSISDLEYVLTYMRDTGFFEESIQQPSAIKFVQRLSLFGIDSIDNQLRRLCCNVLVEQLFKWFRSSHARAVAARLVNTWITPDFVLMALNCGLYSIHDLVTVLTPCARLSGPTPGLYLPATFPAPYILPTGGGVDVCWSVLMGPHVARDYDAKSLWLQGGQVRQYTFGLPLHNASAYPVLENLIDKLQQLDQGDVCVEHLQWAWVMVIKTALYHIPSDCHVNVCYRILRRVHALSICKWAKPSDLDMLLYPVASDRDTTNILHRFVWWQAFPSRIEFSIEDFIRCPTRQMKEYYMHNCRTPFGRKHRKLWSILLNS